MQSATKSIKAPTTAKASARGDKTFRWLTIFSAMLIPLLMGGIFLTLLQQSLPALKRFGFGFLTSSQWNPVTENFGALSSIYGTLVSTLIAMLIAVPLSHRPGPVSGGTGPAPAEPGGEYHHRAAGRHSQYHSRHVGHVCLCPLLGQVYPAGPGGDPGLAAAAFKARPWASACSLPASSWPS